jgi:hypothetical protein
VESIEILAGEPGKTFELNKAEERKLCDIACARYGRPRTLWADVGGGRARARTGASRGLTQSRPRRCFDVICKLCARTVSETQGERREEHDESLVAKRRQGGNRQRCRPLVPWRVFESHFGATKTVLVSWRFLSITINRRCTRKQSVRARMSLKR